MDKIYSRPRIHFPRVVYGGKNSNKNHEKLIKVILILTIAILVMVNMLNAIDPIFETVCIDVVTSLITVEISNITSANMDKYQKDEIISIKQDESGNVQLLQVNSKPLNNMISDITKDIQSSINKNSNVNSYIPFGSITGIKWISGFGPKIPLKTSLSGAIQTKIRNEFDEAGINQTVHRLYLDITCNVNILTPYEIIETQVVSEMVLSENIIIGGVPNVYLNSNSD